MRRLPTREEARMHQLLTVGEAGERGLYCHHTTTTDASCWDSQQTTTHDFRFVTSPCQRSRDVHRRFSSSCELSLTVSHIEQYCERGGRYNPHPLTILLQCHTHSVSCGAQNCLLGEAPREKNGKNQLFGTHPPFFSQGASSYVPFCLPNQNCVSHSFYLICLF